MMNLSHCHIQVKDLAIARRFYEEVFEFSVEFCDQHRAFLKNSADFVLGLECLEKPDVLPNWFHLGFDTKTETKLREVFHRLQSMGYRINGAINLADNPVNFYCADPDGNQIEVYYRR
jgi:catechol-2,3-dioxygenase